MPYATLEQIAHLLKLTPRMVNLHVREHGMPRISRGEYDLVQCVHWYIDYKDRLIKEARRGDESEQQARARLVKATADLRELELAHAREKLIDVNTVALMWERLVVAFKTRMLALPTKLPQRLIACKEIAQIKEALEQEICEALSELSTAEIDVGKPSETQEADAKDAQACHSTAAAHCESMGRSEQGFEQGVELGTGSLENG